MRFLAATHFDGLGGGGALAVDGVALHREEEAVLRGGSSAGNAGDGGCSSSSDPVVRIFLFVPSGIEWEEWTKDLGDKLERM